MVRAIIFDCFGVLTTDLWKEFVASLPEAQRAAARALNHAYDRGHLNQPEFLQEIKELTGREASTSLGLSPSDEINKNTKLLKYIAELKKKYKIGLLSNIASNWITEEFLSAEEQQLFDAMVFSFQIGATKPDSAMFEAVADKLGVPLEDCVMVDDIEHYCSAAEDLGMKSVVYHDFDQFKRDLAGSLGV